jgi:UDPglucose--hexose-1-phosphate uridylyltransferase
MPYNELRKDYLLDRWVVIATERGRRPTDFKPKPQTTSTATCPLCVGNEAMTPAAVMLYLKTNGTIQKSQDPPEGPRPQNWLVRVIPNLFPAFSPPKQPADAQNIAKSSCLCDAIGEHEVVIESPIHSEDPADATQPQLELLINAYLDRFRELAAKPYVKAVSIFRNFGVEAGASLSHAHSQIIATPMVPTTLQAETNAAQAYHKEHGRCVFCDIIERERNGPRWIFENQEFVVLAPYASVGPMEFWILPKRHTPNIADLTQPEIAAFAETLKGSLKALKNVVSNPPYNYGFHMSIDPQNRNCYHWHLEVYPKLAMWAGFEKSTGVYINTVTPETAAESLKKAMAP